MTSRLKVIDDGLVVLMCFALDHRAEPEGRRAFKTAMITMAEVSMETSGAYDFIVQMRFPTLLAFNDFMTTMTEQFRQFVANYETSFVCKRYAREDEADDCLWVPCGSGRQRVEFKSIIKVKAERDYMRVHVREVSWLIHSTIHKLKETFAGRGFLHIHRSTIVNQQHVERLLHRDRHWEIVLSDASVEPVSKSHTAETIRALAELDSSNTNTLIEKLDEPHRIADAIPA